MIGAEFVSRKYLTYVYTLASVIYVCTWNQTPDFVNKPIITGKIPIRETEVRCAMKGKDARAEEAIAATAAEGDEEEGAY